MSGDPNQDGEEGGGGVPEPCKTCGKNPCVCKNPPTGG